MDDESAFGTWHDPGEAETAAEGSSHRYEQAIDTESETTHGRVVRLVGRDRRVLELGPATGHMTAVLKELGCTVVGIEFDPRMAREAEQFAERVIVGDLDSLDLDAELGEERFDVIVAADVLEHLRDPLSLLRRLRTFLAPGGWFVISLPNIAHGSVRLALLEGHFQYRETGLLDRTHLRFFTRENIEQMLDEAELAIAALYRQMLPVGNSEISIGRSVPAEVRQLLEHDPEAETYQFVIKAVPLEIEGLREVQRRLWDMADEVSVLRETGQAELDEARLRIAQLRDALITDHDQLMRRDEEIQRLQAQIEARDDELELQREEVLRLRIRLERILSSPPARAYSALGALPVIRGLKNARTAGYHSAVQSAQMDPRADG